LTGYESISGGLNVELQKPDASDKLFVNTYVNNWGRGELNVHWSKKISDKWSVGILSHGSSLSQSVDKNGDTFLDLPKYNQINVLNRWKYQSEKWMAQFGVKVLNENRLGGQDGFINRQETPLLYGFSNNTRRIEGFSKVARLFPEKPYKGLALIASAVRHESSSWVGTRMYDASQSSAYMNLIYQNIIGDTRHTYKMGTSLQMDNFDESLGSLALQRLEVVPGIFAEYSYTEPEKMTVVIGNRLDYHSLFGLQYTPRLHLKKHFSNHIDWRASIGRGFRVANPLAENIGYLLSARKIEFTTAIQPEIAWNLGTSLAAEHGPISWMVDVYHTRFVQQQIVDAEHPGHLYFYNSTDLSYATAAQIELLWKATERIELKGAYRYFDVKQTMTGMGGTPQLLEKMMVNKHRVLVNASYALPYNKWKVDATLHVNGSKRLPHLTGEAVNPNQDKRSPAFINVNTQITRTFPRWEVYLGAENLTNFRQANPIIQFNKPFDSGFDAGIVWGPIVGRTIYTGMRWKM
jgi:outer membrane receptor protein involved in Fe transport